MLFSNQSFGPLRVKQSHATLLFTSFTVRESQCVQDSVHNVSFNASSQ